jgi:hypothetical protein
MDEQGCAKTVEKKPTPHHIGKPTHQQANFVICSSIVICLCMVTCWCMQYQIDGKEKCVVVSYTMGLSMLLDHPEMAIVGMNRDLHELALNSIYNWLKTQKPLAVDQLLESKIVQLNVPLRVGPLSELASKLPCLSKYRNNGLVHQLFWPLVDGTFKYPSNDQPIVYAPVLPKGVAKFNISSDLNQNQMSIVNQLFTDGGIELSKKQYEAADSRFRAALLLCQPEEQYVSMLAKLYYTFAHSLICRRNYLLARDMLLKGLPFVKSVLPDDLDIQFYLPNLLATVYANMECYLEAYAAAKIALSNRHCLSNYTHLADHYQLLATITFRLQFSKQCKLALQQVLHARPNQPFAHIKLWALTNGDLLPTIQLPCSDNKHCDFNVRVAKAVATIGKSHAVIKNRFAKDDMKQCIDAVCDQIINLYSCVPYSFGYQRPYDKTTKINHSSIELLPVVDAFCSLLMRIGYYLQQNNLEPVEQFHLYILVRAYDSVIRWRTDGNLPHRTYWPALFYRGLLLYWLKCYKTALITFRHFLLAPIGIVQDMDTLRYLAKSKAICIKGLDTSEEDDHRELLGSLLELRNPNMAQFVQRIPVATADCKEVYHHNPSLKSINVMQTLAILDDLIESYSKRADPFVFARWHLNALLYMMRHAPIDFADQTVTLLCEKLKHTNAEYAKTNGNHALLLRDQNRLGLISTFILVVTKRMPEAIACFSTVDQSKLNTETIVPKWIIDHCIRLQDNESKTTTVATTMTSLENKTAVSNATQAPAAAAAAGASTETSKSSESAKIRSVPVIDNSWQCHLPKPKPPKVTNKSRKKSRHDPFAKLATETETTPPPPPPQSAPAPEPPPAVKQRTSAPPPTPPKSAHAATLATAAPTPGSSPSKHKSAHAKTTASPTPLPATTMAAAAAAAASAASAASAAPAGASALHKSLNPGRDNPPTIDMKHVRRDNTDQKKTLPKPLVEQQQRQSSGVGGPVCSICTSNPIGVCLIPCGHAVCALCSNKINSCPYCRRAVTSRNPLFIL